MKIIDSYEVKNKKLNEELEKLDKKTEVTKVEQPKPEEKPTIEKRLSVSADISD